MQVNHRFLMNRETPPAPQQRGENASGDSAMLQGIQKVYWLIKRERHYCEFTPHSKEIFDQEK